MRLSEGLDLQSGDSGPRPVSHWRVSPRIEEHLFATRQETAWLRTVLWLIYGICATYIFVFLRRSDLTDETAWILHIKGYIILCFMHAALFYLYRRMVNHLHIGPGMKRLRHKVPHEGALPIRMQILQKSVITGIDEGYVWMESGTIFFKGLQTVFRLNWEDVPPMSMWNRRDRPNLAHNRMPTTLPIPCENRDLKIKYEILDANEDFASRRRAATFYSGVLDWLHDRPNSALESLLPPTEVHPGFAVEDRRTWEPAVGLGMLTAVDLALLISMHVGTDLHGSSKSFALMLSGLLLILAVWSFKNFLFAYGSIATRAKLQKESAVL